MMFDIMSDDDIECLHEFMDAGNGEAIYEFAEDNPKDVHSVDECIALLKKSVDAGCHLAAEELAYLYAKGENISFCRNDFTVPVNVEEAHKYEKLAEHLRNRLEESNKGRILVCGFNGWMQIRCGEKVFWNSYIFPGVPTRLLLMCINRLEKGVLMAEWFSDEDHGYNISEEVVDGKHHLFIRWKDDENKDQCVEFADYNPMHFASQIADDIESNYFGFSYFMTTEGSGLGSALSNLKTKIAKLRSLLVAESQSKNDEET